MLTGWIVYLDGALGDERMLQAIYLDEWAAAQHMKIIGKYQSPAGYYYTDRSCTILVYVEETEIYQFLREDI